MVVKVVKLVKHSGRSNFFGAIKKIQAPYCYGLTSARGTDGQRMTLIRPKRAKATGRRLRCGNFSQGREIQPPPPFAPGVNVRHYDLPVWVKKFRKSRAIVESEPGTFDMRVPRVNHLTTRVEQRLNTISLHIKINWKKNHRVGLQQSNPVLICYVTVPFTVQYPNITVLRSFQEHQQSF